MAALTRTASSTCSRSTDRSAETSIHASPSTTDEAAFVSALQERWASEYRRQRLPAGITGWEFAELLWQWLLTRPVEFILYVVVFWSALYASFICGLSCCYYVLGWLGPVCFFTMFWYWLGGGMACAMWYATAGLFVVRKLASTVFVGPAKTRAEAVINVAFLPAVAATVLYVLASAYIMSNYPCGQVCCEGAPLPEGALQNLIAQGLLLHPVLLVYLFYGYPVGLPETDIIRRRRLDVCADLDMEDVAMHNRNPGEVKNECRGNTLDEDLHTV